MQRLSQARQGQRILSTGTENIGERPLRRSTGAASLEADVKRALFIAAWMAVLVFAAWLRFDRLAGRPFHCDEATGARITAKRLEAGTYQFDPVHFHGPTLSSLALAACALKGENQWSQMTKGTLRWVPAMAGILVAMLPWLGRRRWGHGPMLLSATLLAASPLLVYYSRMFIHEMLLVLSALLAWFLVWQKPRPGTWIAAGICLGLMFATKETFVITLAAWAGAGLLVAWEQRQIPSRAKLADLWQSYRNPLAWSVAAAVLTALLCYTDGFRHPQGAWDALRTFFIYQTTGGHEKGLAYYFQFLLWPKKSGGVWWCEAGVLFLGLWTYAASFAQGAGRWRGPVRFLAYAAAGHFLIYSLISYKTPWLMCLPWAHVCLLAGFGAALAGRAGWANRVSFGALAILCLALQVQQARQATGRLASDDRNPYAYAPTSSDIETLEPWLRQIGGATPEAALEPIGVIGSGYWPLPWYLGRFEKIGYWQTPPPHLDTLPFVFAVPESVEAVGQALAKTHIAVPRGLRAEEPLVVFVRNDLWQHWMNAKTP